jgi:uncharacterized protein YbjT (DUF2867 family)
MMQVAVIGATGVIGRHVVQRLREHGNGVRPVARSEADVEALPGSGSKRRAAISWTATV